MTWLEEIQWQQTPGILQIFMQFLVQGISRLLLVFLCLLYDSEANDYTVSQHIGSFAIFFRNGMDLAKIFLFYPLGMCSLNACQHKNWSYEKTQEPLCRGEGTRNSQNTE